jgi:hypothetical protein
MNSRQPQDPTTHSASDFKLMLAESAPQTLLERKGPHRHHLTGILSSTLVHTALLVLLLMLVGSPSVTDPGIRIVAEMEAENNTVTQQPKQEELNTVQIEVPEKQSSPLEAADTDRTSEIDMPLAVFEIENIHPNKEPESAIAPMENPASQALRLTLPTGGGLAGRNPDARGALAAANGGSIASEMAVENGLRWIVAHQAKDGSWGFHHQKAAGCQCGQPGERESKTAATGLALLALLGAGYTHQQGPYQPAVEQGLSYLTKTMRNNGAWLGDSDKMYAHAIATIALAEAYQMTGDQRLAEPVEKARHYIERAQNQSDSKRKGSWGYSAGAPGDITVTGWHLMALKSCQAAGFPTPIEIWKRTEQFVDQMAASNGAFGYDQPGKITPATTAIGLFCKMHLGLHRESPTLAMGGDWLMERGMLPTDIYFNYYATQVMYHRQGADWKDWNLKIREHLIATQVEGKGHLQGSWYFDDPHGKVGGRLYTTALAVMTLEVYYRYLPLYENLIIPDERVPKLSEAQAPPKTK